MIELLDFGFVMFDTVENKLCFILLAFNIGLEFMDKIEEWNFAYNQVEYFHENLTQGKRRFD